jgi:dUTP pyrophosphatase
MSSENVPANTTDNSVNTTASVEQDSSGQILSEMFEKLLQTSAQSNGDNPPLEEQLQGFSPSDILNGLQDITTSLNVGEQLDDSVLDNTVEETAYLLQVHYDSPDVESLYSGRAENYETDSGWDLHFTEDVTIEPGETKTLDFGVSVAGYTDSGFPTALWLVPRSSIVKTPLRMANCIGLIDSSYRGTLKAVVDNIKSEPYQIKKGDRLFQIASPTLQPMRWEPVNALTETDRGENGFGSTGK